MDLIAEIYGFGSRRRSKQGTGNPGRCGMDQTLERGPALRGRRLHPWPVRVMHWTNAVAMIVMIGSGWGIYNDSVIFGFLHFPQDLRIGSWAAESLLWHFAGMWLL